MVDNRPQADRILGARLMGTAKRLGRRNLPADEYAAAVAELRELAGGRADLLAETAGLLEGFGEGEPTGPMNRLAVQLCRDAGADPETIPGWIAEGRRRRSEARQPPFSGGVRGGGARQSWPPPGLRVASCGRVILRVHIERLPPEKLKEVPAVLSFGFRHVGHEHRRKVTDRLLPIGQEDVHLGVFAGLVAVVNLRQQGHERPARLGFRCEGWFIHLRDHTRGRAAAAVLSGRSWPAS
jgi:hypothetical protein